MTRVSLSFAPVRISSRILAFLRDSVNSFILRSLASLNICKISIPMLAKGKDILHI